MDRHLMKELFVNGLRPDEIKTQRRWERKNMADIPHVASVKPWPTVAGLRSSTERAADLRRLAKQLTVLIDEVPDDITIADIKAERLVIQAEIEASSKGLTP